MHITAETVLAAISSGAAMASFSAAARHMPDWPLTCEKMWGWFKDSVQEIASQKQQRF